MDDAPHFVAEVWTLFAVAALFTGLRMYSRLRSVGWRDVAVDDYLALAAIGVFLGQVFVAYKGGTLYRTRYVAANPNAPPPEPNSPALKLRAHGSKIHLLGWILYAITLWLLKASVLTLYMRMTTGLSGNYRSRSIAGVGLLVASWVAVMLTIFLSCRPFLNNFNTTDAHVSNACSPGVSKPIVWTCFTMNVGTDLFLISLPIPMLWSTSIKTWKKVGLCVLFSGGAIIIVFATVRCVLLSAYPAIGAPLSGSWSVREVFVAIITSNFPMAFALVKGMLGPAFESTSPAGVTQLEALGGGSNSRGTERWRNTNSGAVMSDRIFTESEEKIVSGTDSPILKAEPTYNPV